MRINNRKQATSPISHPVTHWLLPLILFPLLAQFCHYCVCVCQQHLFSRCNVHFFLFFGTIALLFFLRREVGQHSLLRRPIITVIPAPCILARIPPVFDHFYKENHVREIFWCCQFETFHFRKKLRNSANCVC